jgi:RHS repeat-associated protein
VSGTYTEYAWQASGEELGEHNRTNWTVQVIPFLGRHLAHYSDPSGTDAAYFMHDTKLGSTSQVTDYSGAMAQDLLYYPWGGEWSMVGTYQEMRFARLGHRDETETGLHHRHFRMFSSTEGRWMSRDPLSGRAADPQSLNLYAYVHNAPCGLVDPTGQWPHLSSNTCELMDWGSGWLAGLSLDVLLLPEANVASIPLAIGSLGIWVGEKLFCE